MTNYCSNLLEIEGAEADITAFRQLCVIGEDHLNFNAIIPIPAAVSGADAGMGTKLGGDAELGAAAISRSEVSFPFRDPTPILEREAIREVGIDSFEALEKWLKFHRPEALQLGAKCLEAYRQTGFWSERDWRNANWGTHYWEGFTIQENTPKRLVARFLTAWAPADKIYHEMARRFPTLRIVVSAFEGGNQISYRFTAYNGEVREEEPEVTSDFLEGIEGSPREVDEFYLRRAELRKEPVVHPRHWLAQWQLRRLLKGYPVYAPPIVGIEMLMSTKDARSNFDFFAAQREVRVEALRRFLSKFGVALSFTEECKAALDNWIARYGAFLLVSETGSSFLTHNPAWDGSRLSLNVINDLAVFMGEYAIKESPHLYWEMYTDVPSGLQATDEGFQKPAIAGFQGNPRWRYYPHRNVATVCHALRDMTYLWKRPQFRLLPESHNRRFVSMKLRKTYFLARGDAVSANAVMK